ncbi:hypothetical protein [Nocardioides sp. B-3]|uniref:hypothetical protein n=1 Tax=Nocardioides sp. B-3 TaxID=2895565 RepID=UPI00215215BD|nr:hypothetical protein [Nocardioides sp. B-3]UUZ57858.1 hypothetical protein LP418_15885 [Nocardioides sp. B-3]
MVVETGYAAGDGVLLGAGDHWVLVTDPGDDDVPDEIWDVISGARASDTPITEQVLAIVEKAFGGAPPAWRSSTSPTADQRPSRGAADTSACPAPIGSSRSRVARTRTRCRDCAASPGASWPLRARR